MLTEKWKLSSNSSLEIPRRAREARDRPAEESEGE